MIEVNEKYNHTDFEIEADTSRFFSLGRHHFDINFKNEFDYLNIVKDYLKLSSFNIPEEFKEIFIPRSNAPVYWINDTWLSNQIEEYMKFNFLRAKNVDLFRGIKENYSKWVTTKLRNEKEYYANNVLTLIERDIYKQNFFKYIIHGIILLSQPGLYNFPRIITSFTTAKESIASSRLPDNAKQELLYILSLYIGFAYLRENDNLSANTAFRESLDLKNTGVTAKIYCALTELRNGNIESAASFLNDVLMLDFSRFALALSMNSAEMLSIFIKSAYFPNIFFENEFGRMTDEIDRMINRYFSPSGNQLKAIQKNLSELKEKKLGDQLTPEISQSIRMLERVSQVYSESENIFIVGLSPELNSKFNSILTQLTGRLREKLYEEINQKLSSLDKAILENQNAENQVLSEIENFKIKLKDNLEKTLQNINDNYDAQIRLLEEKIENIPYVEKYNPQRSFSVNMSNNLIVAFIVLIIGALADNSGTESSGLNSFFSGLVTTGIKWGLISFFMGTLVSLIISGLVLIEKSDEKQKLIRKINGFKTQKSNAINDAKDYSAHREKVTLENYNNNLLQYRKNIHDVKSQRDSEKSKLFNEAEEKIREFMNELAPLQSAISA
ncbi:MAG TPA: hypothetical protein PLZ15_01395 [Melioribacteraceae bacterium]|nr:hypothetical protein [Melioribacteraceae bacterium]